MKASASSADFRLGAIVQPFLQGGEDLRPHPHGVGDRAGGDRLDHELLDVDRVVGVLAAVQDVHHRHRQGAGVDAADIAIQRQAQILGRRLGDRERHAEDGVGAEARLVRRAVQVDHDVVDADLLGGVHPADGIENLAFHVGYRLPHALAAVAFLVAVPQLNRLMRAGGSA
jgi:hypothetical protein